MSQSTFPFLAENRKVVSVVNTNLRPFKINLFCSLCFDGQTLFLANAKSRTLQITTTDKLISLTFDSHKVQAFAQSIHLES